MLLLIPVAPSRSLRRHRANWCDASMAPPTATGPPYMCLLRSCKGPSPCKASWLTTLGWWSLAAIPSHNRPYNLGSMIRCFWALMGLHVPCCAIAVDMLQWSTYAHCHAHLVRGKEALSARQGLSRGQGTPRCAVVHSHTGSSTSLFVDSSTMCIHHILLCNISLAPCMQ